MFVELHVTQPTEPHYVNSIHGGRHPPPGESADTETDFERVGGADMKSVLILG